MSEPSPFFYAWCDDANRGDAFVSALSALAHPGKTCSTMISNVFHSGLSVEELIAAVRADIGANRGTYASFGVKLSSGHQRSFYAHCFGAELERRRPTGPLNMAPSEQGELLPAQLEIACGGERSVEVEAAIASLMVQPDVEDLLLRFCAPDASGRVPTGGCTELWGWSAPIEIAATYHADAAAVTRDLALSWVHLYEKDKVECIAGMSLDALHARVASAPHGAGVPVRGSGELSRDTVLKSLATPPAALLEALEACALPDDEWRAVEPLAIEAIEAGKQGAPTYEADVTTRKHVRFLQHHAPYHVRRLPDGGVLLATHPYRMLWPLWADALYLLGIRQ